MKKKLLIGLLVALFIPVLVYGAKVQIPWDSDIVNQTLEPLRTFANAVIKGSSFTATSTTQTNTFPRVVSTYSTSTEATTTDIAVTNIASTSKLTVSNTVNLPAGS